MIRAIIIDDNKKDISKLRNLIEDLYHEISVDIIAVCNTPQDGIRKIENLKPDLVFIDIEMPGTGMNGFDILKKTSKEDFAYIFVTAYDGYETMALKVFATAHLKKPIPKDEIVAAVNQAYRELHGIKSSKEKLLQWYLNPNNLDNQLKIESGTEFFTPKVKEIIYFKSDGNDTYMFLEDGKELISQGLGQIQDNLIAFWFFRIHRQHIVNRFHIKKRINSKDGVFLVLSSGVKIPLPRAKLNNFISWIDNPSSRKIV